MSSMTPLSVMTRNPVPNVHTCSCTALLDGGPRHRTTPKGACMSRSLAMNLKRNLPRFCDPDEFDQDPGKQNHFPTVYIRCLDCGGPAWFNISKRAGQCYICDK